MITKVMGNNLKGKDFDLPLGQRTLLVGPNGSGKSAVIAAIQLAVNGYVPGIDKKNGAIFGALASSDRMTAGIELGKSVLVKQFKSEDEKVSQKHTVNLKSATGKAYASALGAAGNPRVFDIKTFTGLSDDRKIALIFDMFPPAEDISAIESEIDAIDAETKSLDKSVKDARGVCERLFLERSEMALPSGTLAETTREIERLEAEKKLANKALRDAEVKKAEDAATKRAEEKQKADAAALAVRQAEDKLRLEQEAKQPEPEQAPLPEEPPPNLSATPKPRTGGTGGSTASRPEPKPPTDRPAEDQIRKIYADDVKGAIAEIESAADQAGCAGICAVVMVAKSKLRGLVG